MRRKRPILRWLSLVSTESVYSVVGVVDIESRFIVPNCWWRLSNLAILLQILSKWIGFAQFHKRNRRCRWVTRGPGGLRVISNDDVDSLRDAFVGLRGKVSACN